MEFVQGAEARAHGGAPVPGGRRRLARLVAGGAWVYLVAALALWGLVGFADLWWPATFLAFSPGWPLLLPLAVLLPAAAALRRRALGPALLGGLIVAWPVMGFCVPWQRLAPGDGPRLRVLTCNVHFHRPDAGALDRLLDESRPDVVALQECPGPEGSRVLARPGWHLHQGEYHFLASRFPLRRAVATGGDSMAESGSAVRYELETPAGLVTLFSLHLATPRHALKKVIYETEQGPAELEAGSALRWEQSRNLAREASQCAGPVLLVGDFNTPPQSALFRRVWADYADAFAAAGWGWGYTFHGGRTMVRIDHVLAGPGWRCARSWVGPAIGSPHRPVLADLTWTGPAPPGP